MSVLTNLITIWAQNHHKQVSFNSPLCIPWNTLPNFTKSSKPDKYIHLNLTQKYKRLNFTKIFTSYISQPLIKIYLCILYNMEYSWGIFFYSWQSLCRVTVRWRLARPGHLWVCGRKTRTLQFLPTTRLSVEDCSELKLRFI